MKTISQITTIFYLCLKFHYPVLYNIVISLVRILQLPRFILYIVNYSPGNPLIPGITSSLIKASNISLSGVKSKGIPHTLLFATIDAKRR